MKTCIGVAVVIFLMSAGGCVHDKCNLAELQRENVELKSRVATLESQLAELRDEKLAVNVNGITLAPPVLNETPWTLRGMTSIGPAKSAAAAVSLAGGEVVLSGGQALKVGRVGTFHGTIGITTPATSTTTTSATTTSATTPSK